MALLHMYDSLTISKGDVRYPTKMADNKSLMVKAHATHSGNINGNYRFYRPDSMQKATHTWLPFGAPKRPVIVNHKEDSEVLGRVIEAKYIDESYKWASEFPTIKDSIFYKTDGKKVGLFDSVQWIVDNLVGTKGYSGLGYIELGLNITNPEAIEKVLRDEYLTVSVGFTTDSAICSNCHQDWAIDDRCEHTPGEMYDKKQMFLICGPKAYDEVSFVTFPADPFASVFDKEVLKDSLKRFCYLGLPINQRKFDLAFSDSLFTYDITHAEENMDNLQQLISEGKYDDILSAIKSDALTLDKANDLKAGLIAWTPTGDEEKTRKRSLQSTLNSQIRKKSLDKVEEATDSEILSAISTPVNEAIVFDSLTDSEKDYFNDAEGIYAEIEIALDAIDATAKLTQEQKDQLTDADFCGPNKTFPVVNLPMASAAIKVVEDSKLSPEIKQKLINAIQAKKLDLKLPEIKKPEDSSTEISQKMQDFAAKNFTDAASNKEIVVIFETLDKSYDAAEPDTQTSMKGMLSAMLEDWYADGYVNHMKWKLAGKDFVAISSQELTDKDETVNALSDKVSSLNDTIQNHKKINTTLLDTYKRSLATQIVVYKIMSNQDGFTDLDPTSRKEKVDSLAKRHVEYLKDTVNDILSEAKFEDNKTATAAVEPGVTVDDSAHVREAEITTATATTDTRHVVDSIPQYLTPSERKMLILQRQYDAVKKS